MQVTLRCGLVAQCRDPEAAFCTRDSDEVGSRVGGGISGSAGRHGADRVEGICAKEIRLVLKSLSTNLAHGES